MAIKTDYAILAEAGLGAAGIYAFYQLAGYCVQRISLAAIESAKAREKAENVLSHADDYLTKIIFLGKVRGPRRIILRKTRFKERRGL